MKRREGFSLVEVLLVIALLGILLAIGIPTFRASQSNHEMRLAAGQLSADLKYARQTGMSTGGSTVDFTSPPPGCPRGYSIKDSSGQVVKMTGIPDSVNWTLPADTITFSANGSASTGGSITLTSRCTGRTATVSLTAATGMVTVSL
jgi:prepilin-type N-terminal cleavage/methylation domain-containing protein